MSAGTWERIDEQVIRITRRLVYNDEDRMMRKECDDNGQNCVRKPRHPYPGPTTIDTCGLEGKSATQLAKAIRCDDIILQPPPFELNLRELRHLINEAFQGRPNA